MQLLLFPTSSKLKYINYVQTIEYSLNINEIIEKFEVYNLNTEVLLPEFAIPDNFKNDLDKEDGGKRGENAYLKHLTYEGAKERYLEINDEIKERIPEDIPMDGTGEDVIARQIREAAVQEDDPIIRAALWDEYRNN